MRKRSRSKATLDIADRALQDFYHRTYPKAKCEACGRLFNLMHHHLEKSRSNVGRYNPDNLIFMCRGCHDKLHFGDNNVIAIYSAKRGAEWLEKMIALRKVRKQYYTKPELKKIIENYKVEVK